MSTRKRIRRDWPAVFQAHQVSGLTIAAFCEAHHINRALFHRRRRLDGPPRPTPPAGFVELQAAPEPVRRAALSVVVGPWRIEVEPDFEAQTFSRLCACLPRTSACLP